MQNSFALAEKLRLTWSQIKKKKNHPAWEKQEKLQGRKKKTEQTFVAG